MKQDRILTMFPMIFFILGLMLNSFGQQFDGWISWVIMAFGLLLYILFYYWFMQEYAKECKK